MAKKKFNWYAVRKGRKPNIYQHWFGVGQAFEQIDGFVKAEFKGFYTRSEAEAYMRDNNAVLKHYDKLVDRLVAGDQSALQEAVEIGNKLRAPVDGKAPWED